MDQRHCAASAAEPWRRQAQTPTQKRMPFAVGDEVVYTQRDGTHVRATVARVSTDVPAGEDPEISVLMASGNVRETVLARLAPVARTPTMCTPAAGTGAGPVDFDAAVSAFTAATGCRRARARRFLNAAGGNLERAVDDFLATQEAAGAASGGPSIVNDPPALRRTREISAGDRPAKRMKPAPPAPSESTAASAAAAAAATSDDGARLSDAADIMSPENQRAVEYIATSVIASNQSDREKIVARLRGVTHAELDKMVEYLQSCPKIIHFPIESVLRHFVDDTHYRNQFETGSSRGTLSTKTRQTWETTLFGNAYDNCDRPKVYSVRPKYGVVNFDHDPLGCKLARQTYGEAFLVLKGVEDRVTYSWGDSGNLSARAGAAAGAARTSLAFGVWMCRLLSAMPDEDLNTIRDLASGKIKPGHAKLSQYLEFQVHGPIRFAHDVAAVVIPERLRKAVTLPLDWLSFLWNEKVYYRRRSLSARLHAGSSDRKVLLPCGRSVIAPAYLKPGGSFSYTNAVATAAPPGTLPRLTIDTLVNTFSQKFGLFVDWVGEDGSASNLLVGVVPVVGAKAPPGYPRLQDYPPDSRTTPARPPPPPLRVGRWAVAWSERYNRYYWWHEDTGTTSWVKPG